MRPFNFEQASTIKQTEGSKARFLAGGTTLLDLMKLEVEKPDHILDVSRLPMTKISEHGGSVWIGAMALNSDLAQSSIIQKRLPVLSEAVLSGASPQLRNLATTGGNLLQRTRCTYFRDTAMPCNKREPGSGCGALEGVNRSHALLGISDKCIATAPSDMNVALMALGARIHTSARIIEIADFYRLPGETPHVESALQQGELITEVEVPIKDWYRHSHYVKVRDRASYAFALSSVAVALDVSGAHIRDVRIAFGGIGTIPWRSREAESALKGASINDASFTKAADQALLLAKPSKWNAFKVPLAKQTLIRALRELTA